MTVTYYVREIKANVTALVDDHFAASLEKEHGAVTSITDNLRFEPAIDNILEVERFRF